MFYGYRPLSIFALLCRVKNLEDLKDELTRQEYDSLIHHVRHFCELLRLDVPAFFLPRIARKVLQQWRPHFVTEYIEHLQFFDAAHPLRRGSETIDGIIQSTEGAFYSLLNDIEANGKPIMLYRLLRWGSRSDLAKFLAGEHPDYGGTALRAAQSLLRTPPLRLLIDPGSATQEEISRLFGYFSSAYAQIGGEAIRFSVGGSYCLERTKA